MQAGFGEEGGIVGEEDGHASGHAIHATDQGLSRPAWAEEGLAQHLFSGHDLIRELFIVGEFADELRLLAGADVTGADRTDARWPRDPNAWLATKADLEACAAAIPASETPE